MDEFARRREQMVERQVERRGIHDPRVLAAMRAVPREAFVDEALRELAYEDSPLPIEAGQTISQPYIVALMVEAAEVAPGDRVLEIGAGSGYAAAVMASIAREVHAIERQPALAAQARERFQRLGYANIQLREGDGTRGWPEAAPFDAILAAAGGPEVPEVLLRQLAIGGRLVMPVGEQAAQRLVKIVRTSEHTFDTRPPLGDVRFVPLIGAHGWQDDSRSTRRRAQTGSRSRSPGSSPRRPSHCRHWRIRSSGACSTGSPMPGSCCWARPATGRRSSTGRGPRSPGGWSRRMASGSSRWRRTGPTRR